MSRVLSLTPSDLVDLLLDLERLEVVKLGFMRLELCVELVLASLLRLVAFKEDDSATFVTRCEVVSRVVEFDRGCTLIDRDNVSSLCSSKRAAERGRRDRRARREEEWGDVNRILTDDVCFGDVFYFTLHRIREVRGEQERDGDREREGLADVRVWEREREGGRLALSPKHCANLQPASSAEVTVGVAMAST